MNQTNTIGASDFFNRILDAADSPLLLRNRRKRTFVYNKANPVIRDFADIDLPAVFAPIATSAKTANAHNTHVQKLGLDRFQLPYARKFRLAAIYDNRQVATVCEPHFKIFLVHGW